MIEWKKINPEEPVEPEKYYLVTDGLNVDIAEQFSPFANRWWKKGGGKFEEPTHYAEINLPK